MYVYLYYHTKTEKGKYIISLIVESKKNDANEFIFKTETDSQIQRADLWLPRERGVGG